VTPATTAAVTSGKTADATSGKTADVTSATASACLCSSGKKAAGKHGTC
jgi:hypothetical protein